MTYETTHRITKTPCGCSSEGLGACYIVTTSRAPWEPQITREEAERQVHEAGGLVVGNAR